MSSDAFYIVIPARFASSRFPGKALAELAGRTVLEHVWRQARQSGASEVLVATDDERIAAAARGFGAEVVQTLASHRSGTERAAEVAAARGWADTAVVVNCQGDVPLIPPACIDQVAALLVAQPGAAIATLCTPIKTIEDYRNPNVVKVVCAADGRALYFSRAPIPSVGHGAVTSGDDANAVPESFRHVGLYAYRVGALRRLAAAPPCALEVTESLEQLRALWLGLEIRVALARDSLGPDVDTPEDLHRAAGFLRRGGVGTR
ncbi:MAG: 3-deoxy-manno-octulosonate cytidylyltransferase [Chromatiales bacterium]|jgi:3-deoxy-manno-octulosonate cytidylyltransferase (CMP-KDO synthetase)|nr:MAG: 3-deoxy-manno-octulosonate cytidylyltransferase [Chromatiales bacterium]